jgi:CO/xanthine dehydrogenase FAD-binding subunit
VIRCMRAEAVLEGRLPTRSLAEGAAAELRAELAPIDDLRGSAGYRRSAAGGLLIEALLPLIDSQLATTSREDE